MQPLMMPDLYAQHRAAIWPHKVFLLVGIKHMPGIVIIDFRLRVSIQVPGASLVARRLEQVRHQASLILAARETIVVEHAGDIQLIRSFWILGVIIVVGVVCHPLPQGKSFLCIADSIGIGGEYPVDN